MKIVAIYLVAALLLIPLAYVAGLVFSVLYGGGREPLEW